MKLTRLLFILWVIAILPISTANACKCDGSPSVKGAYESAHAVVLGKVARMSVVSLAESLNPGEVALLEKELDSSKQQSLHRILIMKVELAVTQVFKGKTTTQPLIIYTPVMSGACGFKKFKVGESFIVYGTRTSSIIRYSFSKRKGIEQAGTFWTQDCSRTDKASQEEIALLNKMKPEKAE